MAKIDKVEKFLKEEKPKKVKDLEVEFDIKSFEKEEDTDTIGFRSEFEPITKNKEKTLKKEIQNNGGTPGLKKAIKKFEDFKISISVDEVEPEEDVFDDVDCCSDCKCEPCECVGGEEDVTKFSNFNDLVSDIFSENLKYHLKNNKPITENIFRPGSEAFYDVIKEARSHFDSNRINLKSYLKCALRKILDHIQQWHQHNKSKLYPQNLQLTPLHYQNF